MICFFCLFLYIHSSTNRGCCAHIRAVQPLKHYSSSPSYSACSCSCIQGSPATPSFIDCLNSLGILLSQTVSKHISTLKGAAKTAQIASTHSSQDSPTQETVFLRHLHQRAEKEGFAVTPHDALFSGRQRNERPNKKATVHHSPSGGVSQKGGVRGGSRHPGANLSEFAELATPCCVRFPGSISSRGLPA